MYVINKKTRKRYFVLDQNVVNATNTARGEKRMVLYRDEKNYFVRNRYEFWNKFRREIPEIDREPLMTKRQ